MKSRPRKTSQDWVKNQVLKSDDFIEKLRMGNSGMLLVGNIWCFDYALSHLPSDSPILEIGSFTGLSTNLIIYLKTKYQKNNQLICVDAWDFTQGMSEEKITDYSYITHKDYSDYIQESFIRNVLFFSKHNLPHAIQRYEPRGKPRLVFRPKGRGMYPKRFIQSNSDDFFQAWGQGDPVQDLFRRKIQLGGSISFAYIDGNHDYDYVSRDFHNIDRYLEINGFILFDDSADDSSFEVVRLVQEVIDSSRYEIIKKAPNYLVKKLSHK